jgi:hypothetical protein
LSHPLRNSLYQPLWSSELWILQDHWDWKGQMDWKGQRCPALKVLGLLAWVLKRSLFWRR